MTKLAVIGASGLLGKNLVERLSLSYEVIGTYNRNHFEGGSALDMLNADSFVSFLEQQKPKIIVQSAALTDLEECEKNPELAFALNEKPVQILAEWSRKNNAKIVLISTDGVFDGNKGNYTEEKQANPVNAYGMSKLKGELALSQHPDSLIIRVAVLYNQDINSRKFVAWAIRNLAAGKTITACADFIRCPTHTEDIAIALDALLKKDATGCYHTVGATAISMYEAAREIARIFGYDQSLAVPTLSTSLTSIVNRPKDCSLNCTKLADEGIRTRTFAEGLSAVKKYIS